MPDDGGHKVHNLNEPIGDHASGRHDRPALAVFISDARSEEALRDGLTDFVTEDPDIRRGGVRAAIAAMQKSATPKVLVVDVSGEDQPLTALGDLSHVVEPDVCVLVVGEINNADFYREVTRGLGAADYLPKPLTRDKVLAAFRCLRVGPGTILRGHARRARHRDHRCARRRRHDDDRGQPVVAFRRLDAPPHGAAGSRSASRHGRVPAEHPAGPWPAHGAGGAGTYRRAARRTRGAARG